MLLLRTSVAAVIAIILLLGGSAHAQQWNHGYVNNYRHMFSAHINPDHTILGLGGFPFTNSSRTVARITDYGQNWYNFEIVLDDSKPGLLGSHFITDEMAVAVGYRGTVLRTTDMGVTWDSIPCDTVIDLQAVHFADALTGFAAGGDSVQQSQAIFRSTDGGLTWTGVHAGQDFWLRGIHALTTQKVIAVGDSGTAVVSTDGGGSWQPLVLPLVRHWADVYFIDSLNGFIVGGNFEKRTILRTVDGGDNWTVLMDEPGGILFDISFLGSDTGFLVGNTGQFLRSSDAGATWMPEVLNGAEDFTDLRTVHFISPDFGIMMGVWGEFFMYTGFAAPTVQTDGAYMESTGLITLEGTVNTQGASAVVYAVYGTDPGLTAPDSTGSQAILTNGAESFTLTTNLSDNTTYYYACKVRGLNGTFSGDTLSLTTDFGSGVTVQTLPPTDLTTTSVTLHGQVANLTQPANIWFDYNIYGGQTISVQGTPASITDGQPYTVTHQLTGLQTDAAYRYRIRVVAGQSTFASQYEQFYTGVQSSINIYPPTDVTMTSATFHGEISALYLPGNVFFTYGVIESQTIASVAATPAAINDNGTYTISAQVNGLTPNTDHWCRLEVINELGMLQSQQLQFFSGNRDAARTMPATGVNATEAVLWGTSSGIMALPANVWFEYGTDTANMTTVAANPPQIQTSLTSLVNATLSGLDQNSVYKFRLKMVDNDGIVYLGNVRQAHTGVNFIPNYGFETWGSNSGERADSWIHIFGPPEKVSPGQSGNHAVKVQFLGMDHIGGLLNAILNPTDAGVEFLGGVPFSTRPDTLVGMFNYSVLPGDSALVMVSFRKEGAIISDQKFRLGGNTGGEWTELRFPITYLTEDEPDTLVLGFIPIDILSEVDIPQAGSFLMIDELHFTGDHAEIPNGGFENWTSFTVDSPDEWHFDDMLRFGYVAEPSDQSLLQSSDAYEGDYAVEIRNLSTEHLININLSGFLLAGRVSTSSDFFKGAPSFALPHVPQALHGFYKFFPEGADTLTVQCSLFNNGNPVSDNFLHMTQTAADFTPFTLDIILNQNALEPDSAMIEVKTVGRGNIVNSVARAIIDNLRFDGFADDLGLIVGSSALEATTADIVVFPNPGSDRIIVKATGLDDKIARITMTDVLGRQMAVPMAVSISPGGELTGELDTSDLPQGLYIISINAQSKRYATRWIRY